MKKNTECTGGIHWKVCSNKSQNEVIRFKIKQILFFSIQRGVEPGLQ